MSEEASQAEGTAWAKALGQKDCRKFQDLKEGHVSAAVSLEGPEEAREVDMSWTMSNDLGFYPKALKWRDGGVKQPDFCFKNFILRISPL